MRYNYLVFNIMNFLISLFGQQIFYQVHYFKSFCKINKLFVRSI